MARTSRDTLSVIRPAVDSRVVRLEEANRHLYHSLSRARRQCKALLVIGVLQSITVAILAAILIRGIL